MFDVDTRDINAIAEHLAVQARGESVRITVHAHQEMVEEDILLEDLLCVLRRPVVIENYPDHKRGACCLVYGQNAEGRDVHVVCTTSLELAIIITVYEPKEPKWKNPFTRRKTL